MRDPGACAREKVDLGSIQLHAMGMPNVIAQPT